MDFFLHYRNPNFHSSSLVITNNKNTTSFHGKEGEKKMKNKRNNNKVKLSTDPQSVAARERRHRISERFKVLRSLIPGSDTKNMDTVSMLEEAIQYVKYLQSQILLHQTMISFENLDHYAQYPHDDQDLHPFDPFYGDHHHHEMLPQLGFEEGPSFKVEDDDNLLYGHHHHAMYS